MVVQVRKAMSLSSTADMPISATYDELDVVHVEQTLRLVDAANQSANREMPDIDLQRNDTLGLDNDEAAELVGLHVQQFRAYVDDNDFGSQGNFRVGVEIALNFSNMAWIRDNDLETDNLGTSGELAGRTRLENDSRKLFTAFATYQNANAVLEEGAPIMYPASMQDIWIPFRDRFGQGPLVDDDDSIVHGGFMNNTGMGGNANSIGIIDWKAYFDVFTVERTKARRPER